MRVRIYVICRMCVIYFLDDAVGYLMHCTALCQHKAVKEFRREEGVMSSLSFTRSHGLIPYISR